MARRPAIILLLSALTFWPAILFVLPGIGLALATRRASPRSAFCSPGPAAGGWWCEPCPPSCRNYVLPAYPALAILAALWLLAPKGEDQGLRPGWRMALSTVAVLQFLVGLGRAVGGAGLLPELYGGGARDRG